MIQIVQIFRDYGLKIAIDDLGTGFSNLERIGYLHPDIMKVDIQIMRESLNKNSFKQVLGAISEMSQKLGSQLLFEGIETEEEVNLALSMGANLLQGYYFSTANPHFLNRNTFSDKMTTVLENFTKQRSKELYEKGKKAFYSDNFAEADHYFQQVLSLQTNDYETCFYKGLVYEINFDNDKAITELTKAIDLKPKKSEAYYYRGKIYDKLEKYPEAINDYSRAIKYNKQNADLFFSRASLYQQQKKYSGAIDDYSEAIDLNPKDDIAIYNRGLLYQELKDNESAIEDFEEAILIDKAWERTLRPLIVELQNGQ